MSNKRICVHCGKPRTTGRMYCDECRYIVPYANNVAYNQRCRSNRLGLTEHFTGNELLEIIMSTKTCPACGCQLNHVNIAADHIVPLARNGTNTIDNIQVLCQTCNCKKHVDTIDYQR